MNKILTALFTLSVFCAHAQDENCVARIMAKNGGWKKLSITNGASQADYVMQKKFTDAAHAMLSSYTPRGIQAQWGGFHQSSQYGQPVASYLYNIYAMKYSCNADQLELNHETNTKLFVRFNSDFERLLFETVEDDHGPGFNVLRIGFPQEIRPGIWQFSDVRTSLGLGNEGFTKLWLMTYPGQLPWTYVTRREFLLKRKQALQRLLAQEEPRYKEQLQKWELQKKYAEQEAKNDAKKLAQFINVTYKPAITREEQNFKKSKSGFENAIEKIDQQLAGAAGELDKPAIVIKSTSNHLEYNFTNKMERFSEILVKPNPGYFKKGLNASVPQLMEIGIQYFQRDSISTTFARDVEKLVDLDYLQSFIGKTAPPPTKK